MKNDFQFHFNGQYIEVKMFRHYEQDRNNSAVESHYRHSNIQAYEKSI